LEGLGSFVCGRNRLLASDPVTATSRSAFPQTFDAAAQLLILAKLIAKLKFDAAQTRWLRGNWTGLEFKQLPTTRIASASVDLWNSLLALSKLMDLNKNRNVGSAGVASVLLVSQGATIDYAQLAQVLDSTEANLRDLVTVATPSPAGPAGLCHRGPFQLSPADRLVETARIDYILPYWMARYYGLPVD